MGGKFVRCALVIPILGSVNVRSALVADTGLELIVPFFCFHPLTGCGWSYFHISSWMAVGILLFSHLSSTTHNHGTKKTCDLPHTQQKEATNQAKRTPTEPFRSAEKSFCWNSPPTVRKNKFAEICYTVFPVLPSSPGKRLCCSSACTKWKFLCLPCHCVDIGFSLFLPWMGGPLFTMKNFGLSLCENSFGGCFHSPINKRPFLARFSVKKLVFRTVSTDSGCQHPKTVRGISSLSSTPWKKFVICSVLIQNDCLLVSLLLRPSITKKPIRFFLPLHWVWMGFALLGRNSFCL